MYYSIAIQEYPLYSLKALRMHIKGDVPFEFSPQNTFLWQLPTKSTLPLYYYFITYYFINTFDVILLVITSGIVYERHSI